MDKLHKDLEKNHFEIFHQVQRILTKEEILNLFYAHRNASYYPDILEHMMTGECIVMLLVNSCDKIENPEDPDGEEIILEAPVKRWKALIGNKDPEEAKTTEGLRGVYGKDLIMNAFHGADDPKAANKERDVFLFPIPERPPGF
jgi:nucleoside diphosphate kinase